MFWSSNKLRKCQNDKKYNSNYVSHLNRNLQSSDESDDIIVLPSNFKQNI